MKFIVAADGDNYFTVAAEGKKQSVQFFLNDEKIEVSSDPRDLASKQPPLLRRRGTADFTSPAPI